MKLLERELGIEIALKENVVSVLVVEEVIRKNSLIQELYLQCMGNEGNWMLVENEKMYELSKCVDMILEPFSLQLNNKKVKAKLYQDMKETADDMLFVQGLELHSHICSYLEKLAEQFPYPITYKEEWNVVDLLKEYGVCLEENYQNICDKLFDYVKLINQICGIKIFVMVHMKQYLSENQLAELYKLAKYSKIHLVLIESEICDKKQFCEEIYILDKDNCIITY